MKENKRSLSRTHPVLARQWHSTKNGKLTPREVIAGSNKKVWWQCSKGDDHEWQATVVDRALGKSNCSICRGTTVVKSNSLLQMFPNLAKEWHPTKNGNLKPSEVYGRGAKIYWWKCSSGGDHEWRANMYARSKGSGCPFCKNLRVANSNSLQKTHPQLAKEWHRTKNGTLTPDEITAGSHRIVWWQCLKEKDHEWQVSGQHRKRGQGCPFCRNLRVANSNSLRKTNPKLVEEWHPTKNGTYTPDNITAGSHKSVWWKCRKGSDHEWKSTIKSRARGLGCSVCRGNTVVKSNCLKTVYPDLAKEWHPIKNGSLTSENVFGGTNRIVWWQCPKEEDHEWRVSIANRVNQRTGCPYCKGRKLSQSNSLAQKNPDLAKEWHRTKNGDLTPENIYFRSTKKIWWKCPNGEDHEWKASIHNRNKESKSTGCPVCRNLKVVPSNSLIKTNPQLAKEWHPTKNGDLTPENVHEGSKIKIWWLCLKNPEHIWIASVGNRNRGRGCPFCNTGWSINNIRLFVASIKDHIRSLTPAELYILFQQSGLINMYGKGKPFIEALKTGRFPQEELEKFCEGLPSSVDDLIADPRLGIENDIQLGLEQENCLIADDELERSMDEGELPIIETTNALAAMENKVIASVDEEAAEFFITSGCHKLWNHAFLNAEEAFRQAETFQGGEYPTRVKKRFLKEYDGATSLQIPSGYSFVLNNKLVEPNLMQRLAAYRIKEYKKQGNWSGTGAGKTLSAILASRIIEAKVTIICCPNSIVEGWARDIKEAYPDSIIFTKSFKPQIRTDNGQHNYLIYNYETFQQANSEEFVRQLTQAHIVDFIIVDEIHFSKQRVVENMSKRKKVIAAMIAVAGEKNSNLHVFGMSATPVINNLQEGVSLLEMITGTRYDDLKTTASVPNCMSLYQKLAGIGIRWLPRYEQTENIELVSVDCADQVNEIRSLGSRHTTLDLEKILTRARLPAIRKHIKKKTLIYTHYVEDILGILKRDLEKDKWKIGFFTGQDKTGLSQFLDGNLDVLIASSAISTGVDGLQRVCNRLIINILPWTHAEFEQLKGRIHRQGQAKDVVDIIVPLTFAKVNDEKWSWCESKWKRIQFKKSIADAAVDGVVPEGHLRSPAQAYQDAMKWLRRLDAGEVSTISRRKIHIPLSSTTIQQRQRKFGDFSAMNRRINNSSSEKTHERFQTNPEEWEQYHALYREARKEWHIIPYEELIKWCRARPHLVVGDFGCGEAKIAEALENIVYSFDHVAINEEVIAGDMSHVPIDDASLDVAIFSLSLMGKNFTDYLKEAHRCLKLDGSLHIVEATSKFKDLTAFKRGLEHLGFDIVISDEKFKFTFIRAIKSDREIQNIELKF